MAVHKQHLAGGNERDRFISTLNYDSVYGMSIDSVFTPFTTNTSVLSSPHYRKSLFYASGVVSSGYTFVGADCSGLNPFGRYTLAEGIISGPRVNNVDLTIAPNDVRGFGLKNPINIVGWGYDQFGYPSPNYNRTWHASGIFANGAIPSGSFYTTGFISTLHGSNVHQNFWNAAPLDLRYDIHRKVWTPPQSVYAGTIKAAYSSGNAITSFSTPVFASGITYDAEIYDGIANRINVTGVSHVGPKPYADSFKVLPMPSGSFCFIVHRNIAGRPGYGIYLVEPPGTDVCSTTAATGAATSDPYALSDAGYVSLSSLVGTPLDDTYGGTGYGDHPSGTILLGDPAGSGVLRQFSFLAGTGIAFVQDGTGFTIKFASGVNFTAAGINNTITQLTGLTTPLSVSQGGTGAAVKNFVDLSTNQVAGGLKTFASGICLSSGTSVAPSLSFNGRINTGLYAPTGLDCIGLVSSGNEIVRFNQNQTNWYGEILISSTLTSTSVYNDNTRAPLVVTQFSDFTYTNPIQIWRGRTNTTLSYIDYLGRFIGQSLVCSGMTSTLAAATGYHLVDLHRPNDTFRNSTISAKAATSGVYFSVNWDGTSVTIGASGQQTVLQTASGNRTIQFASGYTGDVPVAKVGGGTRTLSFDHGLFTGYTDS